MIEHPQNVTGFSITLIESFSQTRISSPQTSPSTNHRHDQLESSPTRPNRQHDPICGQRMVVCQGEAFALAIMLEPHVRCVDAKRSLYALMMMMMMMMMMAKLCKTFQGEASGPQLIPTFNQSSPFAELFLEDFLIYEKYSKIRQRRSVTPRKTKMSPKTELFHKDISSFQPRSWRVDIW